MFIKRDLKDNFVLVLMPRGFQIQVKVTRYIVGSLLNPSQFEVHLNLLSYKIFSDSSPLTPWLMEPRGSEPHSQGLSNNPYSDPNQSKSSYRHLFKVHSNIVLPSMPRSS